MSDPALGYISYKLARQIYHATPRCVDLSARNHGIGSVHWFTWKYTVHWHDWLSKKTKPCTGLCCTVFPLYLNSYWCCKALYISKKNTYTESLFPRRHKVYFIVVILTLHSPGCETQFSGSQALLNCRLTNSTYLALGMWY